MLLRKYIAFSSFPSSSHSVFHRWFSQDVFGTLGYQNSIPDDPPDEIDHHEAKIADTHRPRPKDYYVRIAQHLEKKDLRGALEILDVEMKYECVKPQPEHFSLLIHECGKRGYTQKAFELYREYTDRVFPSNQSLYSSLFNSCSNSPFPSLALKHATKLREKLNAQQIPTNLIVKHNMIKAFGRCGDLQTSFTIMDEISSRNVCSFNHLLIGCISDKNSGFRHVLLSLRLLFKKKMNPDKYTFHLVLRAARDCGIGPTEFLNDILFSSMSQKQLKEYQNENEGFSNYSQLTNANLPNYLERQPRLDNVIGLSPSIKTPNDRFLLIGNVDGFLNTMSQYNIRPDAVTMTQILDLIPSSLDSERKLINTSKELRISLDIVFFNGLMKRRALRKDYKEALSVLTTHIFQEGLAPNLNTYGILALTVRNTKSIRCFLSDLRSSTSINNEIFGALFRTGAVKRSPQIMVYLLENYWRDKLCPNEKIITTLESFYTSYKKDIVSLEKGICQSSQLQREREANFKYWNIFDSLYNKWLRSTKMEVYAHPWSQYYTSKDIKKITKSRKTLS